MPRPRVPKYGRPYYGQTAIVYKNLLQSAFYFEHMVARGMVRTERPSITEPCTVTIDVAGMRKNGDLDNVAKGVLDALVDAEVLSKDSIMVVRELIVRVVDGEPRTEVTIRTTP